MKKTACRHPRHRVFAGPRTGLTNIPTEVCRDCGYWRMMAGGQARSVWKRIDDPEFAAAVEGTNA